MSTSPALHRKVAQHLRERIESGVIAPGSRMPSERVLAEQFDVSRVTVRQALKDLEVAGLVKVIAGARWVRGETSAPASLRPAEPEAESIEEGATGLVSFSDLASANGLTSSSKVLKCLTRASSLDEADLLGVAPGAPIVELVRLRHLDGIPTLIDFSLIPEGLAPGLGEHDFTTASLYRTLAEQYGLHAVRADCVIEARGASAEIAESLGLAPGDPILEIVQTTFDENRRVVQWCRSVYRGDRYRFRAALQGQAGRAHRPPTAAEPTGRGAVPHIARLYP
ncbi:MULTISPECIES: GntR family transcriptional regulator [unclassified Streptomyces]|uniref:GntR family transcriptional regulator n=1 Tax=unclassified Streptomyces TaxID=2593676 RepID=UPI002E27B1D1|nr:GntR family transcriptional regulator [Streptomyces sp. NBC_00223]